MILNLCQIIVFDKHMCRIKWRTLIANYSVSLTMLLVILCEKHNKLHTLAADVIRTATAEINREQCCWLSVLTIVLMSATHKHR